MVVFTSFAGQNGKVPGKQVSPSKSFRTFTDKRSVPSTLENTLMEHVFLITLDTGMLPVETTLNQFLFEAKCNTRKMY